MEVAAAFAAGLLAGVHCVGMCGGVSGALAAASRGSALARQSAFNAGRIGSYAAAGAVAGSLGGLAAIAAPLQAVQAALLVVSVAIMVLLGLYVAGWNAWLVRLEKGGAVAWRRISPLLSRFVPIDSTAKAVAAGALWGWVPCGLVYSMLVLALASGSAAKGAAVMAAFGLGTVPLLLAAGLAAGKLLAWRRHPLVRRLAGLAIVAMALAMLHRAPGADALVQYAWLCLVPAGS